MSYTKNTSKNIKNKIHIIVEFVGPAGSGKSTLINEVAKTFEEQINPKPKIRFDYDKIYKIKNKKNKKSLFIVFFKKIKKIIDVFLCLINLIKYPRISLFYIRYIFSPKRRGTALYKISCCIYLINNRGQWYKEWQNKEKIKAIHLTEAGIACFLTDLFEKKNKEKLNDLKKILEREVISQTKCKYLIVNVQCNKETLLRRISSRGYKGRESDFYLKNQNFFNKKIESFKYIIQNYKIVTDNAQLLFINNEDGVDIKSNALKVIKNIKQLYGSE